MKYVFQVCSNMLWLNGAVHKNRHIWLFVFGVWMCFNLNVVISRVFFFQILIVAFHCKFPQKSNAIFNSQKSFIQIKINNILWPTKWINAQNIRYLMGHSDAIAGRKTKKKKCRARFCYRNKWIVDRVTLNLGSKFQMVPRIRMTASNPFCGWQTQTSAILSNVIYLL